MYWTPAQMLAHMTVNGAPPRTGDLYASGTVSGPERDQRGCLLELSWSGARTDHPGRRQQPAPSSRTATRSRSRATAPGPDGTRIGFGDVSGTILPARP